MPGRRRSGWPPSFAARRRHIFSACDSHRATTTQSTLARRTITSGRPLAKPHIEHHLLESVEDEFHALRSFVWHHWYVVLVLLVGIALLAYLGRPFPSSTVTIATGPPDSSQEDLGEWFATYFRRNGVSLNLVASKGPAENVDLLASGKVDAAFALGGIPVPKGRGIVSLGSVQFEPFWLLHRDATAGGGDLFALLSGMRLAIGLPDVASVMRQC